MYCYITVHDVLGHTKLIPWSSDFLFENKERVSEIFIFIPKKFLPQSYGASECFYFLFLLLLQSKSLEVRAIFFFFFTHKIFIY